MPAIPQFIYVDLGNVLLHFDHSVACLRMGEVAGIPAETVRHILFETDLQTRYESGQIDSQQFCEAFCRQSGARPDCSALLAASSSMFELNLRMVPVLTLLRAAGNRLGILSNTCPAHWEHISDGRYRIIGEVFSTQVLSYQVGVMKPNLAIYKRAAEVARVAPAEIFFTDDSQANVDGARAAGFDAVLFLSADDLAEQLRARGVAFNY